MPYLVLDREFQQSIMIGDDIKITFFELNRRGQMKIGIQAPRETNIMRGELLMKQLAERNKTEKITYKKRKKVYGNEVTQI